MKAIDANKEILRTLHPDVLDKLRSEGKYIPKALEKLLKQNPCILKDDYDTAIEESTSSQTNIIYVIYAAPDTDVVNNQPCFTEANEGYHNDSIQELQVAQVSHENAIQYEEQLDQQDYNYDNLTTSSEIVSNEYYNQIAMVNNVAESANHNIPIISNDLQTTIIFRDHKEISNDPDISQLLDDIYKDSGVKRKLDQSEDFHVQKHHCNYDNLSSNTLEDPETIGVNNKDDYDTAIEESTSSQTNIIYAALDTNVVNNQPCFTEANEGYHDDSIQELQVAQVSHENAIQHEYYNQIAMVNNVAESANHNIPIINNDLQQTTIIFRDHKEIFDDPNISQLLDDIHKGSGVKRKLDQSEDFYGQKHHCNYDNLSSNTLEDPEIIGVNNMYD
ncbi:hypothetical protein [Candidatus Orientia mediorientalis]|uniref:hypothetical protein n=1 Tax=Candidatus Orientia mediorientalis TaxID=911112 RepID=UPI0012EB91B7|nr:hypothetical protein [Candidatus Orientia mediorientalis]